MKKVALNSDGTLNIMNFELITVLVDSITPNHFYKLLEDKNFGKITRDGVLTDYISVLHFSEVYNDLQGYCFHLLSDYESLCPYFLQFKDVDEFDAWREATIQ